MIKIVFPCHYLRTWPSEREARVDRAELGYPGNYNIGRTLAETNWFVGDAWDCVKLFKDALLSEPDGSLVLSRRALESLIKEGMIGIAPVTSYLTAGEAFAYPSVALSRIVARAVQIMAPKPLDFLMEIGYSREVAEQILRMPPLGQGVGEKNSAG